MFKLISLIFRNVLRSRRRTLLTLASTAISLAILSLMVGIYQGFFHGEDVSEWGSVAHDHAASGGVGAAATGELHAADQGRARCGGSIRLFVVSGGV